MHHERTSLPFHERFAAWLIVSSIVFLCTLNLIFEESELPSTVSEHPLISPFIEITVEGAVEFPGKYQIKKGTSVGEILALAKPLPEANLSKIKLENPVTKRRVIKISTKQKKNSKAVSQNGL